MSAAGVSPQRDQFDSALRVLLIKENLEGTQWVIDQLRTEPIAAAFGPEAARIALWLESNLDKRTAQLANALH